MKPSHPQSAPGDPDDRNPDLGEPPPFETLAPPATPQERRAREQDLDAMRSNLARLSGIGMDFIAAILALGFLGWLIDRWQGVSPVFLLVGIGIGLVYGTIRFIRDALKANRQAIEDSRRRHSRH
ncbi:MAG: AtpZ/AtpI family protein [Phycisphaeraceae bacterium]|nr:AtpZ/AtpI family protein [Phycisphaeraceae bacterium]